VKHRRGKKGSPKKKMRRTEGKPVIHTSRLLVAETLYVKLVLAVNKIAVLQRALSDQLRKCVNVW
jgi:hypothetical protein